MKVDITPNEYRIRIRNPNRFHKKSLRTKVIRKGLKFIVGKLKKFPITAKTKIQAVHFDKQYWTQYNAQLWVETHYPKLVKRLGHAVGKRLSSSALGVDFFR